MYSGRCRSDDALATAERLEWLTCRRLILVGVLILVRRFRYCGEGPFTLRLLLTLLLCLGKRLA